MSESEIRVFRLRMQYLLARFESPDSARHPKRRDVVNFLEEINQLSDPLIIANILNMSSTILENTLLHFAVISRDPLLVERLVYSGHIDLIAENLQRETPRHIALDISETASPQDPIFIILEILNRARIGEHTGGKNKKIKQNRSNKKSKRKNKRNKRRTFRYFL